MNLQIGSKSYHVSVLVLLGAAIFLFWHFDGDVASVALSGWLSSAPQERAAIHKLVAQDSLHRAQASQERRKLSDSLGAILAAARALQTHGLELASAAQTVPQLREATRVLAVSNQVCMDGLTLCKHRGDSLFLADSAHSDSLRHALQAADTSIAQGLAAVECHLIHVGPVKLFGCPSRTTALKVGIVGGVTIVEGLRLLLTGKP